MRFGVGENGWRTLLLTGLLALPAGAAAQPAPERFLLEAGLVGGNAPACPGHYVGVEGRVAGPASVYAMVENYRCLELAGSASRIGASVRLGPARWLMRPAVRGALEYDGGDTSQTVGASLTVGRRYGARLFIDRGALAGGGSIVLIHLGGYVRF